MDVSTTPIVRRSVSMVVYSGDEDLNVFEVFHQLVNVAVEQRDQWIAIGFFWA